MSEARLWVHPDFRRKLKREAADRDITIIELTKELAGNCEDMLSDIKHNKKAFRFRI